MQPDSLSVSSSSLVPDPISDRTDGKPGCESERPVIEIVLSAYVSSGHCYDAYRGSAKVRYPSSKTTVEVPIIAKYIDYDIPRLKNSSDTGSAWHIYGDDDRIDRYEIEIEVLEDLRRTDIAPHLYAAYKGGQASEKRWLVMEDCGVRADLSNPEVQYAVRNAYAVAHASGILHEDVAERHVLSRGGRTKIIDWEGSTRLDWKNRQPDFDEEAEDEIMRMERMLYNYDNPSESEGDTR